MYKIREASQILGLPITALHYYERMELVLPKRKENNYRYYTIDDIERLKLVIILKEYGFTIYEIKNVLTRYLDESPTEACIAEARQFFEEKTTELLEKISGYQQVIKMMQQLPLLNQESSIDMVQVKADTKVMSDALFTKVMATKH